MADPVLTAEQLEILRDYAAGADLGDLARQYGQDRGKMGDWVIRACGLNRNRAKELTRGLPPRRPPRGQRPRDVDAAELDRLDRVFNGVFVDHSPQLAALVDAARALVGKAKQSGSAFFQTPWLETTQLQRAVAALDGAELPAPPAPQPVLEPPPTPSTPALEVLERWHVHRCDLCRYVGPATDHLECRAGGVSRMRPVAVLVVPREGS